MSVRMGEGLGPKQEHLIKKVVIQGFSSSRMSWCFPSNIFLDHPPPTHQLLLGNLTLQGPYPNQCTIPADSYKLYLT